LSIFGFSFKASEMDIPRLKPCNFVGIRPEVSIVIGKIFAAGAGGATAASVISSNELFGAPYLTRKREAISDENKNASEALNSSTTVPFLSRNAAGAHQVTKGGLMMPRGRRTKAVMKKSNANNISRSSIPLVLWAVKDGAFTPGEEAFVASPARAPLISGSLGPADIPPIRAFSKRALTDFSVMAFSTAPATRF